MAFAIATPYTDANNYFFKVARLNTSLVFTFIGSDRPGLVECVAEAIAEHAGSWQESRMVEMAGQFAGIARVQLPREQVDPLRSALEALATRGLQVTFANEPSPQANRPKHRAAALSIIGNDRPGIVREVSRALLQRDINVTEMSSNISSAPMTGEPLFEANVVIDLPQDGELGNLEEALDTIAESLNIEIDLDLRPHTT